MAASYQAFVYGYACASDWEVSQPHYPCYTSSSVSTERLVMTDGVYAFENLRLVGMRPAEGRCIPAVAAAAAAAAAPKCTPDVPTQTNGVVIADSQRLAARIWQLVFHSAAAATLCCSRVLLQQLCAAGAPCLLLLLCAT